MGGEFMQKARDYLLILVGSLIFAAGLNCFEIPNGIAAGGVTGLATVLAEVFRWHGIAVPIGMQVLLMIPVVRSGGVSYVTRSMTGIALSSVLTDLLATHVPPLGNGDLLLCSLWGGVVCGVGLGLVFRAGGNTGGTDIIAQLLSPRTGVSVGTIATMADFAVIAASVAVFGIELALYATIAMYVCNHVVDTILDGVKSQRAVYIISEHYERIAHRIMRDMSRGCTQLSARGTYTGTERPMLFVVISRTEYVRVKHIVSEEDPKAIMFVSEIFEAYGEGFRNLDV